MYIQDHCCVLFMMLYSYAPEYCSQPRCMVHWQLLNLMCLYEPNIYFTVVLQSVDIYVVRLLQGTVCRKSVHVFTVHYV